jgi:hypothetical protein
VFPARYELNSYIVFRKRLVSKRLRFTPGADLLVNVVCLCGAATTPTPLFNGQSKRCDVGKPLILNRCYKRTANISVPLISSGSGTGSTQPREYN